MFHVEHPASSDAPNRLGFAVKVVGRAGLRSNDARRWQSKPHLRVSIGYLHAIFDYLAEIDARMYRMASDLAPYVTRDDMPEQQGQIEESAVELAELGARARKMGLRLSLHPSQYIVLNSLDERVVQTAIRTYASHAAILDGMGLGPDHKIVTHVGGRYGDGEGALARFAERYELLPENVRARLIVENDDRLFGVQDVLWLHERAGIPVVFDWLHHQALGSGDMTASDAARRCLATWPAAQRPKIHFSTAAGAIVPRKAAPHADYIDGTEFIAFARSLGEEHVDVMLEAKMKDAALLRLRNELQAANLANRFW